MIKVTDLTVHLSPTQEAVLHDVSFSVGEGEILAIVGPNGSGKSTLGRVLNGLLRPSSGIVRVAGIDFGPSVDVIRLRESVGMVFQNPDLQMVSTVVEEELAFGPENLGLPSNEIRERVDHALQLLKLEELRYANPGHLSGGQKQRVALAGVLAMQPRVVVLDEPTAMLDSRTREEVAELILEIRKRTGISFVWITHRVEEALRADRVLLLVEGRLRALGRLGEVFDSLDQVFPAFLRSWSLARLHAHLVAHGLALDSSLLVDECAWLDALARVLGPW